MFNILNNNINSLPPTLVCPKNRRCGETFGLTQISVGFCLRNNVYDQRKNFKNYLELAICYLLNNYLFP